MARWWLHDPQYSHGYFVPAFALMILWVRRGLLPKKTRRPSAWGWVALLAAGVLRLAAAVAYFEWLDEVSFLVCLVGVTLLWGGGRALRWAGPAVAFLLFMVPLPFQLEIALAHPLQRLATAASVYVLQTFGVPALAEGNVILLDDVRIGVGEACSGLGMLMTFLAMAVGAALVVRRARFVKFVIVLSAVPIAVIANVTRIAVTGFLHYAVGPRLANLVFHDLAGWLMMPLAVVLLWLELELLGRLFLPERAEMKTFGPARPAGSLGLRPPLPPLEGRGAGMATFG